MGKIKDVLDQLRKNRPGYSYDRIAALAGISHGSLYNLMKTDDPKLSQAKALAKVFDVPVAVFFSDGEDDGQILNTGKSPSLEHMLDLINYMKKDLDEKSRELERRDVELRVFKREKEG